MYEEVMRGDIEKEHVHVQDENVDMGPGRPLRDESVGMDDPMGERRSCRTGGDRGPVAWRFVPGAD